MTNDELWALLGIMVREFDELIEDLPGQKCYPPGLWDVWKAMAKNGRQMDGTLSKDLCGCGHPSCWHGYLDDYDGWDFCGNSDESVCSVCECKEYVQ